MLLTERETQQGTLVAVCDEDVLGETFENGEVSLTVREEFYADGAEDVGPEEVLHGLARAEVGNLVGTEAVGLAVEHGFVAEENVLELEGTRHAQFLRL